MTTPWKNDDNELYFLNFQMLQNFEQHPQAAQSFYQTYFTDILMQLFSVVTDTSHTASLQMHAQILAYMFSLVEAKRITVSLGPVPDNTEYIKEYVANLLKSAFSHLTREQIVVFVAGLFSLDQDVPAFKEHLRDFLIQIKVGGNFQVFEFVFGLCSTIWFVEPENLEL
jgi:exportin-1